MSKSAADFRQNSSSNGITITYAGSEALIESGPFGTLLNTFSSQLPLRNLHWKSSTWSPASQQQTTSPTTPFSANASIRTIQTLPARLKPFSDTVLLTKLKPETRHLVQKSLLERPFCHLYFLIDGDNDAYRTHIRNDIRTWLNTIQSTPTLSAATITARSVQQQSVDPVSKAGISTPRSGTPPVRPDTPTRNSLSDEIQTTGNTSTTKEKGVTPSPEYLIVVITPPEGSALAPSSLALSRSVSPLPSGPSTPNESTDKPAPAKTGLGRFYSSSASNSTSTSNKGSVIEKVKADFNTSRKERVVHLTRLPNLTQSSPSLRNHIDPTIFVDLLTRIKDSVTNTFDAVVGFQDEAVRNELSKKDVPGWNYNKWMAGMECLASTFEAAGLFNEALSQYEEIQSVFLQSLMEGKLPFFTSVGGTTPGDDSAPLLDIDKKDYRDLILRNEISLFDFRCYLFAKRAALLGRTGRISQVMSETPFFLQSVAKTLQGETLPSHFIESWTFSSAIDVVEQCQAWLIERGDIRAPGMNDEESRQGSMRAVTERIADSQLSASFHAAKAELLDLARRQLDRIGISVGHLPNAAPFSLSISKQSDKLDRDLPALPGDSKVKRLSSSNGTSTSTANIITRQEIVDALASKEVFDLRYTTLTERALAGWISSGRKRNVLRLRSALASIHFFRGRYKDALDGFVSLAEPYADGKWKQIESIQLARILECYERLNKSHDKAWTSIVIAILKMQHQWTTSDSETQTDPSTKWLDESYLYKCLRSKTSTNEEEIPVSKFEPFHIKIQGDAKRTESDSKGDGLIIVAVIESKAKHSIDVDDIRVCITSGENGDLWFTSGPTFIQAGNNIFQLHCMTNAVAGKYIVDVSQIRLGKIIFQYVHRQDVNFRTSDNVFKSQSKFINVPEDSDALNVTLDWAPHVFLDRSRTAVLTVYSGRNDVTQLDVRAKMTSSDVEAKGLAETIFHPQPKSKAKMTASDEKINLTNLSTQSINVLLIPFHEINGLADGMLLVSVEIQFWTKGTKAELETARLLQREVKLPLGLPLGVNVQDFFRHDRLLSKFLISAGAAGPLVLGDVALWSEVSPDKAAFSIETPRQENGCTITLPEPASFVFAIRKNEGVKSDNTPLRLTLVYRTVQEEAFYYLSQALDQIAKADNFVTDSFKRCFTRALWKIAEADLERSQLRLRSPNKIVWSKVCKQWCGVKSRDDLKRLMEIVEKIYDEAQILASKRALDGKLYEKEDAEFEITELQAGRKPWRKLSLPVDVPVMTMVNAVTFNLHEKDVRVGVPVEVSIEIATTFAWDSQAGESSNEPTTSEQQHKNKQTLSPSDAKDQDDEDGDDFEDAQSDLSTRPHTPLAKKDGEKSKTEDRLDVSVDVNCDFVNWLLMGTKRTIISVPKPIKNSKLKSIIHKNTIKLNLIALQSGEIALPSISIWPLAEPILQETPSSNAHRQAANVQNTIITNATQSQQQPSMNQTSISSDTFVTNEAERVHVLPRHIVPPTETFWISV